MNPLERFRSAEDCVRLDKRLYQFGCLALALLAVGLSVQNHRLVRVIERSDGPVWFFVDEAGRAHPVNYKAVEFSQGDPRFEQVIKAQLANFVMLHFRRKRATAAEAWPQALLYMSETLARPYEASYRNGEITKFVSAQGDPEVEIEFRNVVPDSLQGCGSVTKPCGASVEFSKVSDGRRTPQAVHLLFVFQDIHGHPEKYLINPLGIVITDLRVDPGLEVMR